MKLTITENLKIPPTMYKNHTEKTENQPQSLCVQSASILSF